MYAALTVFQMVQVSEKLRVLPHWRQSRLRLHKLRQLRIRFALFVPFDDPGLLGEPLPVGESFAMQSCRPDKCVSNSMEFSFKNFRGIQICWRNNVFPESLIGRRTYKFILNLDKQLANEGRLVINDECFT